MRMEERIKERLITYIPAQEVIVTDESSHHIGHAGYREQGETHFNVTVVAEAFAGMTRIERQRLIYKLLKEEIAESIHALALQCYTPGERR